MGFINILRNTFLSDKVMNISILHERFIEIQDLIEAIQKKTEKFENEFNSKISSKKASGIQISKDEHKIEELGILLDKTVRKLGNIFFEFNRNNNAYTSSDFRKILLNNETKKALHIQYLFLKLLKKVDLELNLLSQKEDYEYKLNALLNLHKYINKTISKLQSYIDVNEEIKKHLTKIIEQIKGEAKPIKLNQNYKSRHSSLKSDEFWYQCSIRKKDLFFLDYLTCINLTQYNRSNIAYLLHKDETFEGVPHYNIILPLNGSDRNIHVVPVEHKGELDNFISKYAA